MKILAVIDYETFGENYLEAANKAAPYAEMIWFRIKKTGAGKMLELALRMRGLLPHSRLILSERADVALAAGFDGVHLNASSMKPETVKRLFPGLLTGYSAHSEKECAESRADYTTISPIFDSSKPDGPRPLGLIKAPAPNVYALGGINSRNYGLLLGRGFAGIAGIRLSAEADKFKIPGTV